MILRIASYNVQNCASGIATHKIGADILNAGVDLAGVQEIDFGAKRSGRREVLWELSKNSLPHHIYSPAFEFKDGGFYGTAILSKYPVQNAEFIPLPSKNLEPRGVGRAEIKLPCGKKIVIFNTHLSYENLEVRKNQLLFLKDIIDKEEEFILTGDFNIASFEEYKNLDLEGVNSPENILVTFFGAENIFKSIDNIFIRKNSNSFKFLSSGIYETSSSDHHLLYADIEILNA